MNKIQLGKNISFSFFKSEKFKTEKLSAYFYLPLEREKVASLCLLTALLPDGTEKFPTPLDVSRRCDKLYGTAITSEASKLGDALMLHFSVISLADKYSEQGVGKEARELLLDLIFNPAFSEENFKNEKRLQLEEIEALINDKRTYARNRCNEIMMDDDVSGIILPGTKEQMERVTLSDVKDCWSQMLSNAQMYFAFNGESDNGVAEQIRQRVESIARGEIFLPSSPCAPRVKGEVKRVKEEMGVKQGKLALGFKSSLCGVDADTYKMMVAMDILGGGTYSLLFSNVREKMSLCYYCAARANRRRGTVMIDSGVEFSNMDKTEKAILEQIEALSRGEIPQGALESSKKSLCQALSSLADSQAVTDRWYADRYFDGGKILTPEQLIEKILTVTEQDVARAVKTLKLDTVYKLTEVAQ